MTQEENRLVEIREEIKRLTDERDEIKNNIKLTSNLHVGDKVECTRGQYRAFQGEIRYLQLTGLGKLSVYIAWKRDAQGTDLTSQPYYNGFSLLSGDKIRRI